MSMPRAAISAALPTSTLPAVDDARRCRGRGRRRRTRTAGRSRPRVAGGGDDRPRRAGARCRSRRRRPGRAASSSVQPPVRGDAGEGGLAAGDGAGLVEHDGGEPAGLSRGRRRCRSGCRARRPAGADHDRGRGGQPERARAGDDQHGDGGADRHASAGRSSGPNSAQRGEGGRGQRRARPGRTRPRPGRRGAASAPWRPARPRPAGRSGPARCPRRRRWPAARCVPVRLMVAPMTVSPAALSTGRLSPVSMLSSTAVAPSVTTPSTGTFSPGRTRTRSPTTTCSTGTSTSAPSRSTRAVFGASPTRAVIAAAVCFLALASIHRPIRTSARMTSEVSKYTCSGSPHRSAAAGPQGDEGAVAVGDAGAERDEGVHVGRAVPGGGPGGAVDVRAGPELHDGGDDEDRRHQPVHRVQVQRHVHQHHQAQTGGEGDLPLALERGQLRVVAVVPARSASALSVGRFGGLGPRGAGWRCSRRG